MLDLRVPLKDKFTILIALIIFTCIAVLSYTYFLNAKSSLMSSLRSSLTDLAIALSLDIETSEVEAVVAKGNGSKEYRDLKKKLNSYTKISDRIHGAYVMVRSDDPEVFRFVTDDVLEDRSKMVGFLEEYDVSGFPEMKKAFKEPGADREITEDKWGSWLSGYAPIIDRNTGKAAAMIGIDMKARDVDDMKKALLHQILMYMAFGALLSIILGYVGAYTITGPIMALVSGVKDIGTGKYGKHIDMNRNDEIGDLVRNFNEMSEKLKEVDRMKANFLSIISHELYTPLTPIKDSAEQLEKFTGSLEDAKQLVGIIERQSRKLQTVIDEVLDFSWLDVKGWTLNKEPVSISILGDEAFEQMRHAAEKRGIEYIKHIEPALPVISADRKRIVHVIKILLDNAIKFTPEKGKVVLRIVKVSGGLEIAVEDMGLGISTDNMKLLFSSFFQIEDHMTRTKGGLGLGLAIAKRIVEAHNGTIWAESPGLGLGSRFIFLLPVG